MTGLGCAGRNRDMDIAGTCGECGGAGLACCSTQGSDGGVSACTTGLSCLVTAMGNQCGACGAAGQPCCGTGGGGQCTPTGLACGGRDSGLGLPGTITRCGARRHPLC